MSINFFFLSTPDLKSSPLIPWLSKVINCPIYPSQRPPTPSDDKLTALHQRILSEQEKRWYEQVSLDKIMASRSYQDDMKKLEEQFSTSDCGIHDPLLCYFLPLWQESIKPSKAILYYSEPIKCAVALQQQWRMPLSVGLALWENHIIKACKNIAEQEVVLLSHQQIIDSKDAYLEPLLSELTSDANTETNSPAWPTFHDFETQDELIACVQSAQTDLYELLEKHDIQTIAQRELSYSSANTLEYYGQLRAALEISNADRDTYKKKCIEQQKTSAQKNEVDDHHVTLPIVEPTLNDTQLCNVKVQIEGMDTLEFLAPIDSPILDMLRNNLVQTDHNELIYLNYGETGNEALYFMSSKLLSLETELVNG